MINWKINSWFTGGLQIGCVCLKSPSSRGLGHRPLTAATRVRIPLGTPHINQINYWMRRFGGVEALLVSVPEGDALLLSELWFVWLSKGRNESFAGIFFGKPDSGSKVLWPNSCPDWDWRVSLSCAWDAVEKHVSSKAKAQQTLWLKYLIIRPFLLLFI